jgi:hypothetical protein
VIRQQHLTLSLGAVLTALVVCVGTYTEVAAAKPRKSDRHQLTKREKVTARHRLQRLIQRNPRAVLKKGFLKKAATVDLSLPLTLRLQRSGQGPFDDPLAVTWDSSTWGWPAGFTQLQTVNPGDPAPGGSVPLDGLTSVEADFGNDVAGYDGPGVVETTNGRQLAFTSQNMAPIPVTGLPTCTSASTGDATDPTIPAARLTRMDLVTGEGTHGVLSLFGGTARVSLHVRLATTTQSLAPDCSGSFGVPDGGLPDGEYNQGATPPLGDPIVPISFDATFRISPAIDSDGKLRLGVLTLPSGEVQPSTFGRISTCLEQGLPGGCTVVRFPARLAVAQLNAEILLGDQIS